MPRRSLLSNEQRIRLFAVPVDHAEMAKHYVLSADDMALVRAKRRATNRLGCAVQLCLLRYPGLGMGPAEQPPEALIAFMARQLGVRHVDFASYPRWDQTRREYAVELQRYLGLWSFGLTDWRTCLRVGADAAWATDRGEPIIQAMLAHLRTSGVVLPPVTVLERIGLAARARARKKTFKALATGLSDAERDTLARLLAVDPELRRSCFAWLRDYSESPAPSNIVALLDRLEHARGLGIDPAQRRCIRRFLPQFARMVGFDAMPAGQPVLKALQHLRLIEDGKTRGKTWPTDFVPKSWEYRVMPNGVVDRRAWTLCLVDRLRGALRRRDVFAAPSLRFADPRIGLNAITVPGTLRGSLVRLSVSQAPASRGRIPPPITARSTSPPLTR